MNPSSLSIALEAAFREPSAFPEARATLAEHDVCDDERDTLPVAPPSVVPPTLRTGIGPALPSGFDELDSFDVFEDLDALDSLEALDALDALEPARFAEVRDLLGASQVMVRAGACEPGLTASPERAAPVRDEAITPPPPARRAGLRFGAR